MIKPEQLAKASESSQQLAFFCWAAIAAQKNHLLAWLYHVPNGGSRGDTADSRAIAGGNMKAQGVKPGVPDIHFPIARKGFHSLYIEMKKPALRRADNPLFGCSDVQLEWIAVLRELGHAVAVCYSWDEARDCVEMYLDDKAASS